MARIRTVWTLGGLSLKELLTRTARETWRDAVFGQGGRMAFYHFLAVFPALVVFVTLSGHIPALREMTKSSIQQLSTQVLPLEASQLVHEMTNELDRRSLPALRFIPVCAGALWAAMNGTWAMMYGLNRAYEVDERRVWWKKLLTISGLTACAFVICSVAVFLVFWSTRLLDFGFAKWAVHFIRWVIVSGLTLLWFAILFRFGPNLRDPEWRWSTPGALCALTLWIGSTVGARLYFEHVNNYTRSYGHLNSVVMLLLWLYVANGSVLIGGEMNSEIEKAAEERKRKEDKPAPSAS